MPTPSHSTIYLKDIRLHAFHGVLPQERTVGNDYVINLTIHYPIATACATDNVADTLNYAEALDVVKTEMATQSNLLENVAWRIANSILTRFAPATRVSIDIMKVAPPMPIDGAGAGVTLELCR